VSSAYDPPADAGKIFDNKQNKRSKKSPDYTGTARINGILTRVIGWHNPPSERSKVAHISLKFQAKSEFDLEQEAKRLKRSGLAPATAKCPGHGTDLIMGRCPDCDIEKEQFNDDIPF